VGLAKDCFKPSGRIALDFVKTLESNFGPSLIYFFLKKKNKMILLLMMACLKEQRVYQMGCRSVHSFFSSSTNNFNSFNNS